MEGQTPGDIKLTASQRRRLRRKTLKSTKNTAANNTTTDKENFIAPTNVVKKTEVKLSLNEDSKRKPNYPLVSPFKASNEATKIKNLNEISDRVYEKLNYCLQLCKDEIKKSGMEPVKQNAQVASKARDDVKAAREAKKLAKQAKKKGVPTTSTVKDDQVKTSPTPTQQPKNVEEVFNKYNIDEVDRAELKDMAETLLVLDQLKSKIKSTTSENKDGNKVSTVSDNLTVQDVVTTLRDIVTVAKDVENVTAAVQAMDIKKSESKKVEREKAAEADKKIEAGKKIQAEGKPVEVEGKSKAELKAERRAKQEAQRAAKQAQQKSVVKPEQKLEPEKSKEVVIKKEKSPKAKTAERPKTKSQSSQKCNWFQHLHAEHDKEALKEVAINSNLHPAVIKLGVQLASHVVTGSNARCIALLDALKKMVRDYSLPAKTEFARGLETQLAASLSFLWRMRAPCASQVNAIKHFRHQLTQLPNNVDEFDAKKKLQEEIERYIREQIDMAGEAISIAVRNKISNGDNILTYGCSSLIERILRESHEAGVQYRAVVVGNRVNHAAREMLRRLIVAGVACTYVDISALSYVMKSINKVLLGANALLVNGSVLGAAGTLQAALVARAHNVPVLVACETHKFSDRVQTDAFVYNELGDPNALIDKSDENSPLKDWQSNPNLTLLNLTYDVTPASLVTAVVTELAILPCTSAPVVLRFKTSEYGM